jgi:ectoine hydroxylase-related dioxygenase (phytanoyl-CoA dioxygenase family)
MAQSNNVRMAYQRDGYVHLRGAIAANSLDRVEAGVLSLVREWTGKQVATTRSPEFAELLLADRELERRLYDEVRVLDWVYEFAREGDIVEPVLEVLSEPAGLMAKIPFRIDLPNVTRELAVWHQDYRYVKGNEDIVTAWIPLQDTAYVHGCLMVMPGSQQLGPLEHDVEVLGKRHFPSGIFDREVRYVEMRRGDLLLFNSLLLHSSGVNLSDRARLSLQPRYSKLGAATDESMGRVIPVGTRIAT